LHEKSPGRKLQKGNNQSKKNFTPPFEGYVPQKKRRGRLGKEPTTNLVEKRERKEEMDV